MSKIPEKFICDIIGCENEVPTTTTGKRDYINVHFARTTEETEDRLHTLDKPVLDSADLDLCDQHLQQYVSQLPIVGANDGRRGIEYKFAKPAPTNEEK